MWMIIFPLNTHFKRQEEAWKIQKCQVLKKNKKKNTKACENMVFLWDSIRYTKKVI